MSELKRLKVLNFQSQQIKARGEMLKIAPNKKTPVCSMFCLQDSTIQIRLERVNASCPRKGHNVASGLFLTFLGNYIPQVLSNAGGEVDYEDEGALGTKVRELEKQKADEEQQKTHSKLERDRVHSLFKIAKREIVDKESVARNKDKMVEGFDELHQEELSAYKHKVKHLLQERESCFSSLKTDTANALKLQHRRAKVRQENLNKEKCTLKTESKEEELAHEEIVQQLKLDHAKEITKIRQEFAMARVDMDKKHGKRREDPSQGL